MPPNPMPNAAKTRVLRWIGLIGGSDANTVLLQAFTKEGAWELVKAWFTEEQLPKAYTKDKDGTIAMIRGFAAFGLVATHEPTHTSLVAEAYHKEHNYDVVNGHDTEFYFQLIDAMVAHRLIQERGLEGYMSLIGTNQRFQVSIPYARELTR